MELIVLDIHRLIEQYVQNLGFFAYTDLETEEIDLHINTQVDRIVNGILDKHFGRELKLNEEQGFQKNQVTLDNLRKLHKQASFTTISGLTVDNTTQEVSLTLPEDYYHHIKTTATISYKCYENDKEVTKTDSIPVRIAQSQFDLKTHPFYKSDKDSILAEIIGNGLIMYKNSTFDIVSAKMAYIKKPAVVKYGKVDGNYDAGTSVQCDLDGSLHHMLVKMTSIEIMSIIQANQQKIVNLKQDTV